MSLWAIQIYLKNVRLHYLWQKIFQRWCDDCLKKSEANDIKLKFNLSLIIWPQGGMYANSQCISEFKASLSLNGHCCHKKTAVSWFPMIALFEFLVFSGFSQELIFARKRKFFPFLLSWHLWAGAAFRKANASPVLEICSIVHYKNPELCIYQNL